MLTLATLKSRHKAPYVFPIVGGRKVEHLKGNIDALAIDLSEAEIDEIEDVEPFDVGFPTNFIFGMGGKKVKTNMTPRDIPLITTNTRMESVPKVHVSQYLPRHNPMLLMLTPLNSLSKHDKERRRPRRKVRSKPDLQSSDSRHTRRRENDRNRLALNTQRLLEDVVSTP